MKMIYLNYKKNYKRQMFCLAFVATLTIVLLAFAGYSVKSQRTTDFKPSPFKFNRMPAPENNKPNNISASLAPGSLDPNFSADGKATTDFSSSEVGNAVVVQADGKIVAAGAFNNGANYDFAVFRYNADGSLDTSFDGDGKVITSVGSSQDSAAAVAIQADGKIVAAGHSSIDGVSAIFALVRYNADGSLDASFGTGGKVITAVPYSAIYEIAIQPDGKIIAAGQSYNDTTYTDFALARYNTDGSLDTSFDGDGIVVTPIGDISDIARGVAIQADGKIVVVGFSGNAGHDNFSLARYNADGSLDTSFDADGKIITDFGGSGSSAQAIVLQTDGKIVAAGHSSNDTNVLANFALARYNTDGSLDASFDSDGKVTTVFGGWDDVAFDVAIQRNNKIVAAGFSFDGATNTNYNFALARFNPNGSLDDSFGSEGKVTTDFFGNRDFASAIAIQRDGKIVAAGSAQNGARTDFAAARYIGDTVRVKFDYDGDARADISVFRPSMVGGTWWVMQSSTGRTDGGPLNVASDKIVPADYDGDGRTDIAQFNSSTGTWYLNRSQAGYISFQFGTSGDIPVPADYDGDGKDDVAVYRPSTGIWWMIQSSNVTVLARHFGIAEDKPVAGDYDGDGRSDVAVYRPSQGVWHILQSSDNLYRAYQFGISEDKPIVGDYDGDGKNDLAVYRPSTNVWYVLRSTNGSFFALQFGFSTDIQTPADYDVDGKTDIAVFRPSNGVWYVLRSSNGSVNYTQFGLNGDVPTPSAYVP